ncbi:MAG: hypothetical protein HY951_01070 [Bacteroidia bacterium]|nr:hypothetical protein [Bacteroidia bacterium]
MKTKMFLFVVAIAATVTFISCTKSKDDTGKLNPEQQILLEKMQVSFNSAKVYNDSLMHCNITNPHYLTLVNQYDSCYHANDSLFAYCHANMMNNGDGMMGNNNNMMGNSGGMMGNNGGMMNGNNMCTTQNSELNKVMSDMTLLREFHLSYHPK